MKVKVAIIGGGASGLACAVELLKGAKERNADIDLTIFEKNDRVGKKLLSTGNGKCNLTNINASENDYFEKANFVSQAIKTFPPKSNIVFFEALGMYTFCDREGRVYPLSRQAAGVLDCLRFAVSSLGCKVEQSCDVTEIKKHHGMFIINGKYKFDRVVIAVGSRASVKGFESYNLFRGLGIKVVIPLPSLTRLPVRNSEINALKGIRANVKLTLCDSKEKIFSETGELLFAQNSLSGIVSMQLSPYAVRCRKKGISNLSVYADFVVSYGFDELFEKLKAVRISCTENDCENFLSGFMPKKIGMMVLKSCAIKPNRKIGSLNNRELNLICSRCKKYKFILDEITDFSCAQVVCGGADTEGFSPDTMQSKAVSGLYCIGEALDVDALCGGFNLQWAWSSGRLCAKSIMSEVTGNDKN